MADATDRKGPGGGGVEVKLLVSPRVGAATEFAVHSDRVIVGRAPGCDLVLDDPGILPEHFAIELADGAHVLTRLPGPATVRVNGEIVGHRQLRSGDEIELGGVTITFVANRRTFKTLSELVFMRQTPSEGTSTLKYGLPPPPEPERAPRPPAPPPALDTTEALRSFTAPESPSPPDGARMLALLDAEPPAARPRDAALPGDRFLRPVPVEATATWIGGLEAFKTWVTAMQKRIDHERRDGGIAPPFPRGLTLLGPPGTGKRLIIRAMAYIWDVPLLDFDVDVLLAGDPASWSMSIADALSAAAARAPVILMVSDIDAKMERLQVERRLERDAIAAFYNRVAGTFRARVDGLFLAFTGWDLGWMHPDLVQRGTIVDEIFLVDLPGARARAEILWVQAKLAGVNPDALDLGLLARASDGLTGEELRRAVRFALLDATRERRPLATADVERGLAGQRPGVAEREALADLLARARGFASPA